MTDTGLMDQAFQRIMRSLVDRGRAPHYAELARALALPAEEGRTLLRDVMQAYPIGWLHPETDYIASFPPLNNLPTQYRITVRGEQRWFAVRVRGHLRHVALPGRDGPGGRAVPGLRRSGHRRDARRADHLGGSARRRRPSRLRLRAVARTIVLSLNRHEPLPVGRACAALEPVPAEVRGRLHHPDRSGRLLRYREPPEDGRRGQVLHSDNSGALRLTYARKNVGM